MAGNISILVGNYFEAFISNEVSSGRYDSASEVVKAALKLVEASEFKKGALITAIEEGENSGYVENFNPKAHLKSLHRRFR